MLGIKDMLVQKTLLTIQEFKEYNIIQWLTSTQENIKN